jgi:hypothetical protein
LKEVAKIAMNHVATQMSALPASSVAPTGLCAWTQLPTLLRDPTVEVAQPLAQLPLSQPCLLHKVAPELNTVKSETRRNAQTEFLLGSSSTIVLSLHAIKCALTKVTATTS